MESPVALIARNTRIKERIEFKDESVGCLMVNSAIHLQNQRAAAVCKGAKLRGLNESPCYGFLVVGTPKEVKEVIQSLSQYYESFDEEWGRGEFPADNSQVFLQSCLFC